MELNKIIRARKAIQNHMQDKLSYQTAYKFARFIRETDLQEEFLKENIRTLIDECAAKDENGQIMYFDNSIRINHDYIDKWSKEVGELESTEIDPPQVTFIKEDFEFMQVTVEEMLYLSEFIKEK